MSVLRRLGRALNLPIRRILDHRFHDIAHRVQLTRGEVASVDDHVGRVDAHVDEVVADVDRRLQESVALQVESLALVGQELRSATDEVASVTSSVATINTDVALLRDHLGQLTRDEHHRYYVERLAHLSGTGQLTDLDQDVADLINYALSHRGYAAQAGLWLNPPVVVAHRKGTVEVSTVNERIVEVPFAMRALGPLDPGARVLDFGSSESTIALSLASLGFEVTALDLSRYPFTHPNLTAVRAALESWECPPRVFDAALVISTVEHVGLGWYGEDPSSYDDVQAMARIRELVRPGGVIVLTVPYGAAAVTEVQRVYDSEGLDRLLDGLEVTERILVEETGGRWVPTEESTAHAVALVSARVPDA